MLNQLIGLAYGWHSDLRWLLLVLALVVVVRGLWLWRGRGTRRPFDRALLIAFAISMSVQGALGLIVLIGFAAMGAGFPLARVVHSIVTGVAIAVSFQFLAWDGATSATQARNSVLTTAGALAITLAGMMLLPGGLSRLAVL